MGTFNYKGFIVKNIVYLILISGFIISAKIYNGKITDRDFPFYLQKEATECGPTCLQMIFEYYGKKVPRDSINKVAKLDKATGTNLFDLGETVEHFGFRSLGVKLKYEDIRQAPLPAMLHWNDNHFVVLYKIEDGQLYVADPAFGLTEYNKKDFCKYWYGKKNEKDGGIALLIEKKR
jgi:ATP-binding cassette, subfamily B, bacterial